MFAVYSILAAICYYIWQQNSSQVSMHLRSLIKWLLLGLGGIVGLAVLAIATIYVLIVSDLDRTFNVVGTKIAVPDDEASIAEGKRLARLRGCYDGCHGKTTTGSILIEIPDGTRLIAPDLGRTAREYSIEELDRVIRHGIRPDGTSVILAMPSSMFYHLSDDDFGAIVAFLRSQDPSDVRLADSRIGPIARLLFFYYKQLIGTILAAEMIDHDIPRIDSARQEPLAHGRYLAQTVCTECHGDDLHGAPDGSTPDLIVALAYSIEDFRKLMRTGVPLGDRQLDLMASVAVRRFSHFTDREIDALHSYLRTLATTPIDRR